MNILEMLKDKEKMEEFKRTQELRNEYNSLTTMIRKLLNLLEKKHYIINI